jgi:hypothetical protein
VAPDGAAGDELGHSVNLVGDDLLAGAPYHDGRSGAVYLFHRGAAGWELKQKLTASDGTATDQFGRHSPQLNAHVLVAGAANQDAAGSNAGAVYVFRSVGDTWVEADKLIASDASPSAQFGWWLDLAGYDLAIGAPLDQNGGLNSGAAYVLSLPLACGDGLDNDGDGFADLDDPGCADGADADEHESRLACDDGMDNDGDGKADYLATGGGDPGCWSAIAITESPQCQDGLDNDGLTGIDFDGGDSLDIDPRDGLIDAKFNNATPAVGDADPECVGRPSKNRERTGGCGLGFEVVFLTPVLARLARKRRA